ncbi:hypothetical protein ZWY2020_009192 [Hordeum vulgare]|nr:hypothetical protein ZWY2020_009192 [Hordeum vulgare]
MRGPPLTGAVRNRSLELPVLISPSPPRLLSDQIRRPLLFHPRPRLPVGLPHLMAARSVAIVRPGLSKSARSSSRFACSSARMGHREILRPRNRSAFAPRPISPLPRALLGLTHAWVAPSRREHPWTARPACPTWIPPRLSRSPLWWGYHNLSVAEDVVENYRSAQIPLDVIWNDDDHMDARNDFTLGPVNYPRPKLLAFLDKIHKREMKYIVAARHVHQQSPMSHTRDPEQVEDLQA